MRHPQKVSYPLSFDRNLCVAIEGMATDKLGDTAFCCGWRTSQGLWSMEVVAPGYPPFYWRIKANNVWDAKAHAWNAFFDAHGLELD